MMTFKNSSEYKQLISDVEAKQRMTQVILEKAEKGYYGDFTSPIAYPKSQLADDLMAAGWEDLAKKARMGYYDF